MCKWSRTETCLSLTNHFALCTSVPPQYNEELITETVRGKCLVHLVRLGLHECSSKAVCFESCAWASGCCCPQGGWP